MSASRHRFASLAVAGLLAAFLIVVAVIGCGQSSRGAEPAGERNGSDTPVVLILLDELPTANLMTANGKRINARRYPQIARFASGATWYRDNVAAGDFTAWAVPGILTGNLVDELTLPTAEAQPDNFFTLLGPGRTVHSLETVTELCPVEICPDGHQGEVPGVEFADDFIKAKFKPFAPAEVKEWIAELPAGPGTLSFAHVEVPHQPLRFLPSGQAYKPGPLLMPTNLRLNGWTTGDAAVGFVQSRHLIQTGYADRLVGRILKKIRDNGDYDDAMIVLTADHGISFDPADLRRDATATNPGGTVNPPLIIKYSGQRKGMVSNAATQALDIMPTIAKQLGASIPPSDGQRIDQATPDRVMTVSKDELERIEFTVDQIRADRRQVLADQYRRLGRGDLWRLGPRSYLIGRRPGKVRKLPGARYGLYLPDRRIRRADRFANMVPALISGRLARVGTGKVIALAWNGRIVATTRSFGYQGKVQFGAMVPPSAMKRGHNRITIYKLTRNGLRRIARA